MTHSFARLAPFGLACALAAPFGTGAEQDGAAEEEVARHAHRTLAPASADERVQWVSDEAAPGGELVVALLALEEALGDRAARARFDAATARALERIGSGGRIAVAPREVAPTQISPAALYLDLGRLARRLGERGLAFERELPLRACGGRRAAWVFVRGAPLAPLDVETLPKLPAALGGQRFGLLAEAPSRAAAASALHRRGLEDGVEEWLLDERWAPDEEPAALAAPRLETRRFRSGSDGAVEPRERLNGVLVVDALHGALDRVALLDAIHAALAPDGQLWILERTTVERRTALEDSAKRSLEPRRLFRELVAAGFAVRAIEEREGAVHVFAARAARAPARGRDRGIEPWSERWSALGLAQLSSAHVVGTHALLGAADLRALGTPTVSSDPWMGPAAPVPLVLVASWSRHPAPALFLDRPEAMILAGGWLALVHDLTAEAAPAFADPDAITALQPALRFEAELAGAALGWPDAALWLFRRP
ncbi:MAG: hypothetical protein IPN34_13670 [Planctomycetes bacterium]|nr:hypothetical protein [Planctomycetota bacterium]